MHNVPFLSSLRIIIIFIQVGERYATVVLTSVSAVAKESAEMIKNTIEKIKEVVQKMVQIYAKTFRVNFSLESSDDKKSGNYCSTVPLAAIVQNIIIVCLSLIHI